MMAVALKDQRGVSPFTIVLGLVVAAFAIWLAARVLPVYFEYWSISSVFQEQVRKGNLYQGPGELETVILKELRFQDIKRLSAADVKVEHPYDTDRYKVWAEYEAEVELTDRVRLVFHFRPEGRTGG